MTLSAPPASPTSTAVQPDVRRAALATLVGAVVTFALLALWMLGTASGQRLDDDAMRTVVAGRETQLTVLSLLGYVSIGTVGVVTVACVGLALARGRARLALAAVAVVGGANVTTQVLKHGLLDRVALADGVVASNSLPSGHTTVVASAVGALCLVSPRVLRPLAVVAGSFAITLTGASTVVAGWHRPADVVASVLVVAGWTALAALVVGGRHAVVPASPLLALLGSGSAIALLVLIGVRPSFGWSGFGEAAVVLGVVAAATAAGVTAMHRASPTS